MEADLYRKLAGDCINQAERSSDLEAKTNIIKLAHFWLEKAERAEAKTKACAGSTNSQNGSNLQ
jgi:hypothetical protein